MEATRYENREGANDPGIWLGFNKLSVSIHIKSTNEVAINILNFSYFNNNLIILATRY
jgi:hypothetical protein